MSLNYICRYCLYGIHEWHELNGKYECVWFCYKNGKRPVEETVLSIDCKSFRLKGKAVSEYDFSGLTVEQRNNLADNLERLMD